MSFRSKAVYPSPPAFDELSGLDLSHLSSQERAAILEVAARAKQIDQVETLRVKKIQKQVVALSRPLPKQVSPLSSVNKHPEHKPPQSAQPIHNSPQKGSNELFHDLSKGKTCTTKNLKGRDSKTEQHQVTVSENSNNMTIICELCGKNGETSIPENMLTHDKSITDISRVSKPHNCTVCNRTVCQTCVVVSSMLVKKGEVFCKLCTKQRELAVRSNAWMTKNAQPKIQRSASVESSKPSTAVQLGNSIWRRRSFSEESYQSRRTAVEKESVSEALVRRLSVEKEKKNTNNEVENTNYVNINCPNKGNSEITTATNGKNKDLVVIHNAGSKNDSDKVKLPSEKVSLKTNKDLKCEEQSHIRSGRFYQKNENSLDKSNKNVNKLSQKITGEIFKNSISNSLETNLEKRLPDDSQSPVIRIDMEKKNKYDVETAVKVNTKMLSKPEGDLDKNVSNNKTSSLLNDIPFQKEMSNSNKTVFHVGSNNNFANALIENNMETNKDVLSNFSLHMKKIACGSVLGSSDVAQLAIQTTTKPQVYIKEEDITFLETNNSSTSKNIRDNKNQQQPGNIYESELHLGSAVKGQATASPSLEQSSSIEKGCHVTAETKSEYIINDKNKNQSIKLDDYYFTSSSSTSNTEPQPCNENYAVNQVEVTCKVLQHRPEENDLRKEGNVASIQSLPAAQDTATTTYTSATIPTGGILSSQPKCTNRILSIEINDAVAMAGDTEMTLPSATSVCSSLGESEGPAEWSVDDLDDGDTLFLVTSSDRPGKENIPTGITRPSELRQVNPNFYPRFSDVDTQDKENNIDVENSYTKCDDFDLFLHDEEKAMKEQDTDSGLKRLSPIGNLSAKYQDSTFKSDEQLSDFGGTFDSAKCLPNSDHATSKIKKDEHCEDTRATAENNTCAGPQKLYMQKNKGSNKSELESERKHRFKRNTTGQIDTQKQTTPSLANGTCGEGSTLVRPVPAKRHSTGIPSIMVSSVGEASKVLKSQSERNSDVNKYTLSATKQIPNKGEKNCDNDETKSLSSSVYVCKFGSKVLQPASSPFRSLSPLALSNNDVNCNNSKNKQPNQQKVYALHKAGYFENDSESEVDEDDEEEKEMLRYSSSVPIHPEEMEESSSTTSVVSSSPRMFFRRTTSTDNFEELLKRATETPRIRKSSANLRPDKRNYSRSGIKKKSEVDGSFMARSVSLSPPNAAKLETEITSRRKSAPVICKSTPDLAQIDSRSPVSPTPGSYSSIPSFNASSHSKKSMMVSLTTAASEASNDNAINNLTRCVSCGVLPESKLAKKNSVSVCTSTNTSVKVNPPRSLQFNKGESMSVNSSTQVTPDQPATGFSSFLPSVDLCQLTALIEALRNVQGLGTLGEASTTEEAKPSTPPRTRIYKNVSTETSVTGQVIISPKDRVLQCRPYENCKSIMQTPTLKRNSANACVGTQDIFGFADQSYSNLEPYYSHVECSPRNYTYNLAHPPLPHQNVYSTQESRIDQHNEQHSHYGFHHNHHGHHAMYRIGEPLDHHLYADKNTHFKQYSLDSDKEELHNWYKPPVNYTSMSIGNTQGGKFSQIINDDSRKFSNPTHHLLSNRSCGISLPEHAELVINPKQTWPESKIPSLNYDKVPCTLMTLPNDNFSLRRSASVPAVAPQNQITTLHNRFQPDLQSVDSNQSNTPHKILLRDYVSNGYSTSGEFDNQSFYSRHGECELYGTNIHGDGQHMSSLDESIDDNDYTEMKCGIRRSLSKRSLPQPPEEDEFRWRYNNNKRFNTLYSVHNIKSHAHEKFSETEPSDASPIRIRQTMEDLDQEEKELDMRLRYLELGRQSVSGSHSSIITSGFQTTSKSAQPPDVSCVNTSRTVDDCLLAEQKQPVSRKTRVVNLAQSGEPNRNPRQRNYVIVDDVTQIINSGVSGDGISPNVNQCNRQMHESSEHRLSSSRVPNYPYTYETSSPQIKDEPSSSSNEILSFGHRNIENAYYNNASRAIHSKKPDRSQITGRFESSNRYQSYNTRFVTQDQESMSSAYVRSQAQLYPKHNTETTNKSTDPTNLKSHTNDDDFCKNRREKLCPSLIQVQLPYRKSVNAGENRFRRAKHDVSRKVAVTCSHSGSQRDEDMRTVVSETEAYNLRQEMNDWFDKPEEMSPYAELSNDQQDNRRNLH